MGEAIDQLMAELEAAASSLRTHGSALLPPASMLRVERRAADVAAALLGGEPLPVDGTDELLSVESEVAPQEEQRPVGEELEREDTDTLPGAPVPLGDRLFDETATVIMEDDEEDLVEEATVLGADVPEAASSSDELVYVTEDLPSSDLDEAIADDPSDAGLVSFSDDDASSYVSYDEPASEEELVEVAPPPVDPGSDSYVSYDEVPVGQLSDADLALGEESLLDEDEEVTLASIPLAPEQEASSFSDVGEDALVTIEAGGDDLLGDLDASEGADSFDLMPDNDAPVLEDDDEVTLVSGLEDVADDGESLELDDLEEIDLDDGDSDEVMVDDARGAGVHAAVPTAQVAGGPRVTAGLYGNPSVPTIREGNDPVPKAAAVQLNSQGGGGRMLGLEEEEEPIELGSVGDYGEDEDEYDGGDGLSIAIQEYDEEEEEEYEEEEELELEPEPPPPPPAPKGPSPQEIQAIFDRATAAANSGALQEAADLFSDVVDADPDHLDAHVGRGRLYLDLGDYSRAMSDFMVAEEIDEESPEPQVAIGDLYFHRKDYRKAIEYFDTALKMAPNHAMAFCRRGISHYYRKNYKDALGDLEKANKLDSDIPNIASFISMAKRKAKKR